MPGLKSGLISEATARTKAGGGSFYIPTHRDVAAMDGAPDQFELWKENRQRQKQNKSNGKSKYGILRCAQNDKCFVAGLEGAAGGCGGGPGPLEVVAAQPAGYVYYFSYEVEAGDFF
jgi:hypothetical protein